MSDELEKAFSHIRECYRTLSLHASGAVAQIAADKITHSKSGSSAPRDFHSEAEELVQRVVRLARVSRAQLQGAFFEGRLNADQDRHHPVKRTTKDVVLEETGRDSLEVAFIHGVRQDVVERHRREAGRDPKTGERGEYLTEPPGDTVKRRHRERSGS